MGLFLRLAALAALVLAAPVVNAQQVNHAIVGNATVLLPAGWSHDDLGAFTSPDGGLTVLVRGAPFADDPDDVLDAWVEQVEKGETVLERGDPEEVREDDGHTAYWTRTSKVTTEDGRSIHRLYAAAYDKDADETAVAVASGEPASWAAHGDAARRLLESLTFIPSDSGSPFLGEMPESLPAEGGLEGVYFHAEPADVIGKRWERGTRTLTLYFSPLGEVYRSPLKSFKLAAQDSCGAGSAWSVGRYRIEGATIVMRWCDKTVERWPFEQSASGIKIGRRSFLAGDLSGLERPKGAYLLQRDFSSIDMPLGPQARPALRFLDDGQVVLEGMRSFGPHDIQFAAGVSTPARYRLKGSELTLVYERGTSEVVGFARLPGEDGETLLVGGLIFRRPD